MSITQSDKPLTVDQVKALQLPAREPFSGEWLAWYGINGEDSRALLDRKRTAS